MKYFPLFIKLDKVLVVGGGIVAQRKITQLLECETAITVISPKLTAKLTESSQNGTIRWLKRKFLPGDTQGYSLVIAAVDNQSVNEAVFREASSAGIPVNVVDQPALCTVIFPAIVKRGDLTVSISTNGRAPFITKSIKNTLEKDFPKSMENEVKFAGEFRDWLKKNCDDKEVKQMMYNTFMFALKFSRLRKKPEFPGPEIWSEWLNTCKNAKR